MTSQPDLQKITTHTQLNISRHKGNQTIKSGQSVEHPKRKIFIKKICRNEAGKLVRDYFFVFQKAVYQVKESTLQLGFTIS